MTPPQQQNSILIVDDQPTTRLILGRLLINYGYSVVEAECGEEAIHLAEKTGFAAILLDYQMTGIDGIETCRRLRLMEKHKVTPILIITVADEDVVLYDAFATGCDDFIVKPINQVVLHARLQAHIHRTELYYQLEQVRKMLNRYISPRTQLMVEQCAGSGNLPPPIKREVCVLFTDIRGFTQLSQRVAPEHLFAMLSQHLSYQVELVYQYSGYVDKYAGDGIMAIFEGEDMAECACQCALEIIRHARDLMRREGDHLFAVGCGLNAGTVVIGNIGSPEHLDYSVVGETVNLAARLCGLAEPMCIVISDSIRQRLSPASKWSFQHSQCVRIKGFAQAIRVCNLLASMATE